jgi:hypothetical protein
MNTVNFNVKNKDEEPSDSDDDENPLNWYKVENKVSSKYIGLARKMLASEDEVVKQVRAERASNY